MIHRWQNFAVLVIVLAIIMPLHVSADEARFAGVLLYFKNDGKTWALLGHDGNFGVWCDFGGGKTEGDRNDLMRTANRELKEETRYVYGEKIRVTLNGPHKAGAYLQYFSSVPFVPLSVLMRSSPEKREGAENEMNSYMWIPLDVLFSLVKDRPNAHDYRDIELPEQYIPVGIRQHGQHRPARRYLRSELAETLDEFRKNPTLVDKYFK